MPFLARSPLAWPQFIKQTKQIKHTPTHTNTHAAFKNNIEASLIVTCCLFFNQNTLVALFSSYQGLSPPPTIYAANSIQMQLNYIPASTTSTLHLSELDVTPGWTAGQGGWSADEQRAPLV